MKTTLEIPDPIFRRAKAAAAEGGVPLRQFVSEAVAEKLDARHAGGSGSWIALAGKLRHLHRESARISRLIAEEFERVEPEDEDEA